MQPDKTMDNMVAMYIVTWYDGNWNELKGRDDFQTAHEMWDAIERWNQACQRIARDPAIVITPPNLPHHVSIQVRYVERKEKAKTHSVHSGGVEGCDIGSPG